MIPMTVIARDAVASDHLVYSWPFPIGPECEVSCADDEQVVMCPAWMVGDRLGPGRHLWRTPDPSRPSGAFFVLTAPVEVSFDMLTSFIIPSTGQGVRLRASGSLQVRCSDPGLLVAQFVGLPFDSVNEGILRSVSRSIERMLARLLTRRVVMSGTPVAVTDPGMLPGIVEELIAYNPTAGAVFGVDLMRIGHIVVVADDGSTPYLPLPQHNVDWSGAAHRVDPAQANGNGYGYGHDYGHVDHGHGHGHVQTHEPQPLAPPEPQPAPAPPPRTGPANTIRGMTALSPSDVPAVPPRRAPSEPSAPDPLAATSGEIKPRPPGPPQNQASGEITPKPPKAPGPPQSQVSGEIGGRAKPISAPPPLPSLPPARRAAPIEVPQSIDEITQPGLDHKLMTPAAGAARSAPLATPVAPPAPAVAPAAPAPAPAPASVPVQPRPATPLPLPPPPPGPPPIEARGSIVGIGMGSIGSTSATAGEIPTKVPVGSRVLVPGPSGLMQSATVRQLLQGYYELEVGSSGQTIWVPIGGVVPE